MDIHSKRSLFSGGRPATTTALPFSPPPCPIVAEPVNFAPVDAVNTRRRSNSLNSPKNTMEGPYSHLGHVTVKLAEVYHGCDPTFRYDRSSNPRRVLTKPGKPIHNNGHDNEKWDYILYVNDVIGEEEGRRYVIIDLLGQGTFGQVVKCQNVYTKELVAVKVIKNQPAYYNQSMMEVTVLEMINNKYDRDDTRHVVRLRDTFVFRNHLCIVVELLSVNLYELIKQNQYRGFSLKLCRIFLAQVLDAMCVLKEARIVHCDLKPENILLRSLDKPAIKVIDFGSACHEHQTVYTYIQSRFYRSPEVLLGLPYSSSIDMWSLGCIAVELFLGLPIFPGASNYDQVSRIVETLGLPPFHMLEVGKDTNIYFERIANDDYTRPQYRLKTRDRFSLDQGKPEPPSKRYFASTDLEEVVMNYPMRGGSSTIGSDSNSQTNREEEQRQRRCFLHFVRGLLTINPVERWSPLQAISHPFVTGQPLETLFGAAPINVSRPIPRTRPRANTFATLSLQDVPGPLQKLAAAAQGSAAPPGGPTDYRDVPEAVNSPSSQASTIHPVVLQDYAGSLGSFSGSQPSGNLMQQNTNSTPKKATTGDSYYTNRYVDNRRVSNPAISIDQSSPLSATQQSAKQSDQQSASSLPSWYHPAKRSPYTKRRDSFEALTSASQQQAPTQQTYPNSPLSSGAHSQDTNQPSRARRKSTNLSNSPSMGSIHESEGS